MKLADWEKWSGFYHTVTPQGQTIVIIEPGHPCRSRLWELEDYMVAGACGSTIWLKPRTGWRFDRLKVGQKFRFVGGSTPFIKISKTEAAVLSQPHKVTYVAQYAQCMFLD